MPTGGKRAIVTGATGFVGRHLLSALKKRGYSVLGLGSKNIDFSEEPGSVAKRLLATLQSFEPDVVFHLAGPKPYWDAESCYAICVSGTEALLGALERLGRSPKLVVAGSSAEYGFSSPELPPLDEEAQELPTSPYGKAKLHQTKRAIEAGGVVLRLFNCVGPTQEADVVGGRIVAQIAAGSDPIFVKELRSKRDFVDVRDAVEAFLLGAEGLRPGIYNVCSGNAVAISELLEVAIRAAGGLKPRIVIEDPDHPGSFQRGDPSKIEGFGWRRRFSLEDSMRDAIEVARRL